MLGALGPSQSVFILHVVLRAFSPSQFVLVLHVVLMAFGPSQSVLVLHAVLGAFGPSLCIFFLCNAQGLPRLFILYGAPDLWQTKFNLIFILFYNLFYMWKERRKIYYLSGFRSRDLTI